MAKAKGRARQRGRLSLSVRLSLLVLLAALLPLAAVVGINDYLSRGALISQGTTALANDATAKANQISSYMSERIADGQAMAALVTAPQLVGCVDAQQLPASQAAQAAQIIAKFQCNDPTFGELFAAGSNCRGVNVGVARLYDPVTKQDDYTQWAVFDAAGHRLLTSGSSTCTNGASTPVAREDYAQVMQDKSVISAVYYDPTAKYAYINIYTPIVAPGTNTALGFLRATLRLNHIWAIVAGDSGSNGSGNGSYAFITDQNGVRIADTDTADLFTSVMPLDASTSQLIATEQRYGSNKPVPVESLPAVAQSLKSTATTDSFQGPDTPGSTVPFQFARILIQVPSAPGYSWSYFALSPLSTVTAVADNQIRISLIIAAVIAVLAILLGLLFGRGTTRPVRASAAELVGAAAALKTLASRQQSSAGEQQWVVDACRTGLESVRYLSDAMNQAAKRIIDASNWFSDYWDRLTEEQARRTVTHLNELARYIDEAARRQQASSERMSKAINVTMQVSDQLVHGADAATQYAAQLEQVVRDLRHVVGGAIPVSALDEADQSDAVEPVEMMMLPPPQQSPLRNGHRSSRLDGHMQPMQPAPRQLAAPGASQTFDMMPRTSRPPQAPNPGWGQRQPGASQTFDGDYGDYGGYGNGGYGNNGNGSYGGYGNELGVNPWSNMPPDSSGRGGWDNR